jgi:hypothetical protein
MICKICFEEETLEDETICESCKKINEDCDTESLEELIEKISD